jgi:crossover junction endodeoxyribonuclease RuvC
MIILGVDPGLETTGYGVIDVDGPRRIKLKEAGVIRTKSADTVSVRLASLYGTITEVIGEYGPDVLVLERLYSHYKHPATAILMGHARGVICLAAGIKNVKLINYPPARVKKAITGKGSATKMQMQGMVQQALGLDEKPSPADVADALACALTYVNVEMRVK